MLISQAGNSCALCPEEAPRDIRDINSSLEGQLGGAPQKDPMWSLTLPQLALACLPLAFSLCQGVLGPGLVGSKAGGLEEKVQGRSLEQLLGQKERALRAAQQGQRPCAMFCA